VARNTLEQGQCVANAIARRRGQLTRIEERIDRDDLLEKAGHDTETVPQDQGQFRDLFSLLAELHQSAFSSCRIHQLRDPLKDFAILLGQLRLHSRRTLIIYGRQGAGHRAGTVVARGLPMVVVVVAIVATVVVLVVRRGMGLVNGNAVVVLLLGGSGSHRGGLSLGLLLCMIQTLMALLLAGLLPRALVMLPVLLLV